MSPAAGLGWVLAVLAWTVLVLGRGDIAGLAPRDGAALLAYGAIALWLTGWAAERSRRGWRPMATSIGVWCFALVGMAGAFLHRDALFEAARNLGEEAGLGLPLAVVGQGGEVSVTRRIDGTFMLPVRVNGREVPFLFDTGASSVVLSADTARLLGFDAEVLRFRVPVTTANGRGLAAPVTLENLAVGPIVLRRVPALVVRAGMLDGNLLGQTFLEKLESYEVRGSRLVLRAAKV